MFQDLSMVLVMIIATVDLVIISGPFQWPDCIYIYLYLYTYKTCVCVHIFVIYFYICIYVHIFVMMIKYLEFIFILFCIDT